MLAKTLFLVYMLIVFILLINMLIAMMGQTYQLVNDTEKEYLRQWAHVVLVIEHSVSTGGFIYYPCTHLRQWAQLIKHIQCLYKQVHALPMYWLPSLRDTPLWVEWFLTMFPGKR